MNFNLLKATTFEDYQRRLNNIINDLTTLQNEKTGLYKRIINFDRQLLYSCMCKVINVSQSSIIYNRDELSFFESICHFFHYYMYDDGELCIKWEKYKDGEMVECKKTDKLARPYLSYKNKEDELNNNKTAYEKECLWLLDYIENQNDKRIKQYKDLGFDDDKIGSLDKEFIDYEKE